MSFGDFKPLCRSVPSYPLCNLFFHQLASHSPSDLHAPNDDVIAFQNTAPVGINIECGIPRAVGGNLGNIANVIVAGLSFFVVIFLAIRCSRRVAAVGRVELRTLLLLYALTLPLQIVTNGALLEQNSKALVILTSIHAGSVALFFWALLANAIVATQVVEDGTMSSLVPFWGIGIAFFAATTYISLDTAFTITSKFGPSSPPSDLHNIPLFVLTSIWPAFCALAYFIIMTYVVVGMLREGRPILWYAAAAILFVLSQLDYFLLSKVICRGANQKVDGSFIATLLETASIGVLYLAWTHITEESWDEPYYDT